MDSKDTLYLIEFLGMSRDFDEMSKDDEALLCQGIKIARLHRMNLSAFKKIITPNISTQNDEDQWTFDYESYLQAIAFGYEIPEEWGKRFYRERWIK